MSFLAEVGTDISIRELALGVGLPRSTVHRICQSLVLEGVLALDERTTHYQWGPTLMTIARAAYQTSQVRDVARPVLHWVVRQCDETAVLALYDHTKRLFFFTDRVETSKPVRYYSRLYEPQSPHAGASGKVMMAFLPTTEVEAIIESGLYAITPRTITQPDVLRTDLARIRREGGAVSHGERRLEAVGIGAPIFDNRSELAGSLLVTVPAYRSTPEDEARILSLVKIAAERISRAAGLPAGVPYPPAIEAIDEAAARP
jgi:DNA-binding IclR family transcriptional regulator